MVAVWCNRCGTSVDTVTMDGTDIVTVTHHGETYSLDLSKAEREINQAGQTIFIAFKE